MALNEEDVRKIIAIVRDSHYAELRLAVGDLKLHIRDATREAIASAPESLPSAPAASDEAQALAALVLPDDSGSARDTNQFVLRAPVLGIFLHGRQPDEDRLVNVGDKVGPHDTIGLIRVLDDTTPVKAGVAGMISRIDVPHGALVEYEQALMVLAK